MNMNDKATPAMPSAAKVVEVLFAFSMVNPHLTAAEVADIVGINRSTAHRLLQILETARVVRRRPGESSSYELAARVLQLSETFLHQLDDLHSASLSYLTELVERTGETAALHVRQRDARVGIVQVESPHPLRRTYTDLGQRVPLYLGAPSLAMLAFLPQEQIDRYVPRDDAWPSFEFADRDALMRALEAIRSRGFAVSHAHRLAGVTSIAAPIRSRSGDVIASINVSGPETRFSADAVFAMSELVVQAARRLSEQLGYPATASSTPSTTPSA
jgi:DNA-binding IclR family transcriptional regulator